MSRTVFNKRIEYRDDLKQVQRLSVKGYKYVSRVQASGEYTAEILKTIKQTSSLKLVRTLDFDPYFCNISELGPLCFVLKKLKRLISNLGIVFRRFTIRDEVKNFSPFLTRLRSLRKIRLEFPNPRGIESQDIFDLTRSLKQLCSLKSADVRFSG